MSRLRIVHVSTFYPPHNFGGDGVHVQRLAEAQLRRGHDVEVVCSPAAFGMLDHHDAAVSARATDPEAGDGGPRVRHTTRLRSRLEPLLVQQTGRPVLSRARLRAALEPESGPGPDVIHFHNVSLVGGVGVLGMGNAVKLYTTHEYWLVCPTHLLFRFGREPCAKRTCVRCTLRAGRPPQWWRFGNMRDEAVRHIDRAIYPSASTREVYQQQGLPLRGEVLHHFLPSDYLRRAADLGARSADSRPYFLYVGRLDAVKGIDRLLAQFAASDLPAPLCVVGDGPLGPELRGRYQDDVRIRFLGTCTPDQLGPLYRDALALILPSAGYEIFGLVVAEAFAHGTPAVVSAACGAGELVLEARAGSVFGSAPELDRALTQIAADPGERDAMGGRGRHYVTDRLNEERYLDRYEELVAAAREERAGLQQAAR